MTLIRASFDNERKVIYLNKKMSLGRIILNIALIAMSLTYILPLVLMISNSVSTEMAIIKNGYTLIPSEFSLSAYKSIFQNPYQILQSYKVTIIFSIVGTILATVVQSLMAYPLSRPNFTAKKFLSIYLLITMLFSGGLVPHYLLNTKYLHLNDTMLIYILPYLTSVWNVLVFKTFFAGLPNGLVEAGKIDGASELVIFFKIVFPLSTPVFASIGFMTLIARWNDWNTSLLYIRDTKLYSLQYLLQRILREAEYVKSIQTTGASDLISSDSLPTESMRYAMAVVAAGPMLIIFPFFQKYFAKGLTVGSVKG